MLGSFALQLILENKELISTSNHLNIPTSHVPYPEAWRQALILMGSRNKKAAQPIKAEPLL
ncbi:hypothetical protein BBD41_14370 [Paenibacillus ihbetae]|uniref:Uncharacterized protein n=1 Tax=Paenibacillus ihbetae TaxID=1870820 RepID=A0A1B2E167_9BACL|nr:hypothetical protein BBD41_14370 [Paenibacillus ihbetae]OOC57616.1 hypothetical protein BBD40_28310 [Paenibacillus ihbetae]